ncbi:MAG: hypothetical protein KAX57_04560 [Rhodoferax sp.]|jgi:hypothetical protein|uniref:hypothetical protein n=1 Tax=Rhodoferax sp. TaxID=50421 RepID=UPI001B5D454C|nr:hypothetical protein [Rhodoferax sp.]MBP8286094.1 hypothetical protein [Rhodoferax sp.]MBP9149834.1 hypothetical protein [Rhodoferax sp.]MBP9737015.1 hypothetical protein [Rhodoferax sp.]
MKFIKSLHILAAAAALTTVTFGASAQALYLGHIAPPDPRLAPGVGKNRRRPG